jgi:hypothetical protein
MHLLAVKGERTWIGERVPLLACPMKIQKRDLSFFTVREKMFPQKFFGGNNVNVGKSGRDGR